ncbi:MAG: hypothetical protein GY938_15025 [Ketobacter sp.]|nr:hypothetical protein [Ketobacter sp.]
MTLLSIDPGPEFSGAVLYNQQAGNVVKVWEKVDNHELLEFIATCPALFSDAAIEMVASYGMAVGKTVFETCVWIGRYHEKLSSVIVEPEYIYRKDVKMELCNSMKAKDTNIRRALLDRFPGTGGGKTPQVGTKSQPGPLYGVSGHAWAALGVAVTWAAMQERAAA